VAGLAHGVSPRDPLTLAATASLLLACSLIACYVPARRASRVDPASLLREE
jgi:ABC-type lipoprotein release transport system permease subunit